jgi:hypothetical protein
VQEQFLDREEAILKRLNSVYAQSLKDINAKVKELEFNIKGLTEQYDWMDDDDPEKAKVKSQIQSKIYQKQYQEQLQKQVDGILNQLHEKQYTNIADYLDECYSDGFIGTIFDMHGQGVPLMMPIDQESMVRAVQLDSKISSGLYTRLGEDVNLLKKKITAQVSRAISTGMTYAQTAQQLAGYTNIGLNNSMRIARTEGHRIQCTAAMDACQQAKERGADVVKQWDATLDARTRESHAAVDGEIKELDEKFSNGLMFPGDPAGGAAEVVNCRCALLQRARWAVGGSFTKMNNFTKEIEEFESPEAYDEFKKAFFSKGNRNYMKHVENMQRKYKTKDFRGVLDAMDDREYKQYSKLLANNPIYNKIAVEKIGKSDTIKSITIDDFRKAVTGSAINDEVVVAISNTLSEVGALGIFNNAKIINAGEKVVFQTDAVQKGTFFDVIFNINEDVIGGMSVAEIDKLFEMSGVTVANSLRDAVVHEAYHAKLIKDLNYAQLENLYDTLEDVHIEGLSATAHKDGSECIAEVGVLIERGEKENIPRSALELFNRYMEQSE